MPPTSRPCRSVRQGRDVPMRHATTGLPLGSFNTRRPGIRVESVGSVVLPAQRPCLVFNSVETGSSGRGAPLDPLLDVAAAVAVLAAKAPTLRPGSCPAPTPKRDQVVFPGVSHPGYLRDLSLTLKITHGSVRPSRRKAARRRTTRVQSRRHPGAGTKGADPLAQLQATSPRVLAVNGQDPALY